MIENDDPLSTVGSELLSHSQELGTPIRLPLTTQLFPFLLLASRRMTTREMSNWLSTNKGVKLSAPMITKGLKRPDLHLRRIAEFVEPLAAFVAAVHHLSVEWLLFGEEPKSGNSALRTFSDEIWITPEGASSDSVRETLGTLIELWEPIPDEVKYMCRRYFDFTDGDQGGDADEPLSFQDDES